MRKVYLFHYLFFHVFFHFFFFCIFIFPFQSIYDGIETIRSDESIELVPIV